MLLHGIAPERVGAERIVHQPELRAVALVFGDVGGTYLGVSRRAQEQGRQDDGNGDAHHGL